MNKQDLIDLAIEYGMIRSSADFNNRNEKQQQAIINQIRKVAR
jgi:hypothetical protein